MVFVKVRETYDLHTTKDKMTVIAIHTPKPDIIKRNYPGLLMQCKMYRPYSCDVRVACASLQPLDPLGIGTSPGDVAPEDVFNPILYKAMSNKGMSQLEARINQISRTGTGLDVDGSTAGVEVDSFTTISDEFNMYYGLLSQTHEWKHASPQAGLTMTGLRPLVYEMVYNVGDMYRQVAGTTAENYAYPDGSSNVYYGTIDRILGSSKPMPFIPCTQYSANVTAATGYNPPGFPPSVGESEASNAETTVPYLHVVCGCIIVPPSKLHELFYRMVVEWTIEFSQIRQLSDIATLTGIATIGAASHYQNYSYSSTKKAITGSDDTILDKDSCMVSANVDVNKVM